MNKSKYKQQLGKFSEFCKSKKRQSIKENSSSVEIAVPFWNNAVQYAIENLRQLGGGRDSIDWNRMVDRIKMKFSLLNIFDKGIFTDDSFVIAHVKDIVYHNYCADGYLSDAAGDADNYDSQELGAKAFVLSKLADAVLQQVKEESGIVIEPEPEEPTTVAAVSLEAGWGEEDYSAFEQRSVKGFNDFAGRLKESVDRIRVQDKGRGLDYCLNKIEKAAGSIKMDDILKVIENKNTSLKDYLSSLADEYMKTAGIGLNESIMPNNGGQRHISTQARIMYSHEIVRKLMEMIKQETPEKL